MTNKEEKGILTLYSDVQATSVRWLWYPFIAVGKITLLQGDPGDGKSTMMMHLIAELSKGGTLPDGKTIGMPQRAIYQCSEDGISDTIKPRLEKCGADCRNVAFINEETYSGLTLDDERIRQAIIEFRPRLVVIDPIQAYLGSDSDLQIAGRARRLMQRLGMWASMYDCAIVLIGHLNKKEGTKGLYRSLGSIDVVAAARSVLQVERDAEMLGYRISFEGETLYVFDLLVPEIFHEGQKRKNETDQKNAQETKPANTRKGFYPDDIAGTFGVPVEEHLKESEVKQMDGYVSVGMLTGKTVPDTGLD